jgi:hypothetical protein
MNAQSVCLQINQIQDKLRPLIPAMKAASTTQDEFLTSVLTAANLSSSDIAKLRDHNLQNATSNCVIASTVNQSNVADFTTCADVLGCANRLDPIYKQKLISVIGPDAADQQLSTLKSMCTFKNVQLNDSQVTQNCFQNQSIATLATAPFDPVIQGIVQALTDATPIDCSKIPTSVTRENLQKTYQSCIQQTNINQSNIALCAGDSEQTNSANVLQLCVQNLSTPTTTAQNPTTQDPSQASIPSTTTNPVVVPVQAMVSNLDLNQYIPYVVGMLLVIVIIITFQKR